LGLPDSCEGIVSKWLGYPYRSGRVNHWLKIKNPAAPAVKREGEEDWGAARRARVIGSNQSRNDLKALQRLRRDSELTMVIRLSGALDRDVMHFRTTRVKQFTIGSDRFQNIIAK
jgi:ATP-dependent DNA ligase